MINIFQQTLQTEYMSDYVPSSGWQDGELIIIPHYCAILELKEDNKLIPIYIFVRTVRVFNCPYDLNIGKDIKDIMFTHEGRLPVRCLQHNNDLFIINAN